MIFALVQSNRVKAQEGEDPAPPSQLQALVDGGWEKSADFRALLEAQNHITLSKENAWQTLKASLPRTTKAVEEAALRRWYIEVIELEGGYVKINNFLKQAGGFRAVSGRFAPLAFVWFLINMNLLIDDILEDQLIADYMANGISEAQAREAANRVTDTLRTTLEDPTCFVEKLCLGDILNEIERVKEHRLPIPREQRHHIFMPVGEGSFFFGPPCAGAGQIFDPYVPLPVGTPSAPGSNGTEGTATDTIDVTASPLPCLR
jgi:hypothetical protein